MAFYDTFPFMVEKLLHITEQAIFPSHSKIADFRSIRSEKVFIKQCFFFLVSFLYESGI